jgi:hypothetical protein
MAEVTRLRGIVGRPGAATALAAGSLAVEAAG